MAVGDAQRVWFPEMLEALASTWSASLTWAELADFCGSMAEKRRAIRQSRGIEPPRMRCPKCGAVSRSDIPGISIRSALFALRKGGLIDEAELEELDRNWRKHKAKNRLDAYGRRTDRSGDAGPNGSTCCGPFRPPV